MDLVEVGLLGSELFLAYVWVYARCVAAASSWSELCAEQNYFGSLVMGIYSEMNLMSLCLKERKV